jgi:hypothetical protein
VENDIFDYQPNVRKIELIPAKSKLQQSQLKPLEVWDLTPPTIPNTPNPSTSISEPYIISWRFLLEVVSYGYELVRVLSMLMLPLCCLVHIQKYEQ